jgi:hypothetical protein
LVRVQDFVDWLENALVCLRHLERAIPGRSETIYRVSKLSLGSATIEIEARSEGDQHSSASAIVDGFLQGAEAIKKGKLAETPFDMETKTAFARLLTPLRRQLRGVTITADSAEVALRAEQASSMVVQERVQAVSVGSYSGFIDALNVHKQPVFYLYPTSGPVRIPCEFDQTLLDDLRGAIKRYTTVFGAIEYPVESPFPSRIVVDRVEINPPEEHLPTLRSLYGSAPDLTRGLDSVTYVRRQRDAET